MFMVKEERDEGNRRRLFSVGLLDCANGVYIACFKISTGDVEDAPALDALNKFDVFEKDGAVYVRATEADIKAGKHSPVTKCAVSKSDEKVVVVGG